MNRTTLALLSGAASLLAHSAAVPVSAQQAGARQTSSEPVIYLNQGWSQDDREWYYHFSQGSAVLSYDIYLNLEAADSQDLLRSDANSLRYGLIPGPVTSYNPDGLPIGISKTIVATPIKGWPAGDYAGVTCAACHEGELTFQGKRIRIQGGNSRTFDLQGLARSLDDALQGTLTDAGNSTVWRRGLEHRPRMQRTSCASELRARQFGCMSTRREPRSALTRGGPDAWMPYH
jgi:hypothetical protein